MTDSRGRGGIDYAPLLHAESAGHTGHCRCHCSRTHDQDQKHNNENTTFKVLTIRTSANSTSGPALATPTHPFGEQTALFIAKLIALAPCGEFEVVESSDEAEFVADALESLWGKVMSRVGISIGK